MKHAQSYVQEGTEGYADVAKGSMAHLHVGHPPRWPCRTPEHAAMFSLLSMNSMSVLITTISCRARRDGPELKRDENGQVAEVRLPSKLSTAMSFLTVIASVFLGVSLGGTFSQLIGNRFLIRETWMVSAVQCSM